MMMLNVLKRSMEKNKQYLEEKKKKTTKEQSRKSRNYVQRLCTYTH